MLSGLLLFLAISGSTLQNPGFEASDPLSSWEIEADKKNDVSIRVDQTNPKQGRQSLLIEARNSTEATVRQELSLPVGTLWRAKVSIRTDGLKLRTPTGETGLIEIQTPPGNQGRSKGRTGNTPWGDEEVLFRVPPPGHVTIALVGLNHAYGRVWFDDVRLEEVPTPSVTDVRIFYQRSSRRPIDLKQGGQFIEPLCRLIPSMLAQQVESDSFEEEPAWKVSYKREIDRPYRPWYPDGAVHLARFSLDTENPFNGKRSQRIDLPVARARVGISQDGFYVRQGVGYRLRLHMRSQGNVRVWASLRGGGRLVAGPELLGRAGESWQKADVLLKPRSTLENATLNIEFEGPGTLWVDRVYVIGEDAVLGLWRPDVVAALKAMKPGVIRFGGSTLEVFEWDRCIGSWDMRAPYVTGPWGGLDHNFVGVEEFVKLCQFVGAEPLICVRWTDRKPSDAASEVEYFNGGPETTWGKVRVKNGQAEPYRVKYWQIGNEVGGATYDASIKSFAEAMRSADPTIKVLSSYPSVDTLQGGGGYLDYLCPHHYHSGDLLGKQEDFKFLQDQIEKYANGKDVRVAVTEWNTTAGEWGLTRGMLQTLGNALSCSRYQNLLHRYADLVEIAVRSNLADSFGSGVILTGPGWMYLAPTYYSQLLYQRAAGSHPLRVERSDQLPWQVQEPDLSATLTEDGRKLQIYTVNSTRNPVTVRFDLRDFPAPVKSGEIHVLKDRGEALDSEVMNTRDDPERIVAFSRVAELSGKDLEYRFEPFSLTVLELNLGN
jgi:alpha-N-arabinofuranosidase